MKKILIFAIATIFSFFSFLSPTMAAKITPDQLQTINQEWASSLHSLNGVVLKKC